MCRLFGQISPRPAGAEDLLVRSDFSLLKQSDFNKSNLQKDGWGIAWFGNKNRALVSKSPKPVFKEAEKFKTAAAQAVSQVVIGHIRAASNPRGVPKRRLINRANTQPFTDGRWVFAHNGTLQIPDEVAKRLGALRKNVKSMNDSEVFFWQFMKFRKKTGDVAKAFQACIKENWDLWKECRARYPEKKTPYTSLNALVSDGKSLHALCHSVRRGLADFGVCNPTQPWSVMSFTRRGNRVVIASENLDRGRWTRFSRPEILSVSVRSGQLRVRRRKFKLHIPKETAAS